MKKLLGANVLVTGGAGTIGSTLVDQLLDAGAAHVDVLDNLVRGRRANLNHALATGLVQLVEGDLRDRDLVHDLTRGKDLVFHQAAIRITQCAEEPRLALEVLVDGTFNVFEVKMSIANCDYPYSQCNGEYRGFATLSPSDYSGSDTNVRIWLVSYSPDWSAVTMWGRRIPGS